MAYAEDLDRCTLLPLDCDALFAVGWLARGREFSQGTVESSFFERLEMLAVSPWQPVVFAGFHACDLCQFQPPMFSANLFIPYDGRIFVAPSAITHYIAAHWYRPPEEFVQAVITCPAMSTMEYKKAILANGGRTLVRAVRIRGSQIGR